MRQFHKVGFYVFILFLIIYVIKCKEPEVYPVIPEITYTSFDAYLMEDTVLGNKMIRGVLNFTFVDGDGDIGTYEDGQVTEVDEEDTSKYDLYVQKYSLLNSNFVAIENPGRYYLPYFEPEEKNGFLKGEVSVTFDYFDLKTDTFYYQFYIYDRKKNKSNVESSEAFILNTDSIL